jgi:hypothetical protein
MACTVCHALPALISLRSAEAAVRLDGKFTPSFWRSMPWRCKCTPFSCSPDPRILFCYNDNCEPSRGLVCACSTHVQQKAVRPWAGLRILTKPIMEAICEELDVETCSRDARGIWQGRICRRGASSQRAGHAPGGIYGHAHSLLPVAVACPETNNSHSCKCASPLTLRSLLTSPLDSSILSMSRGSRRGYGRWREAEAGPTGFLLTAERSRR